MKSRIGLTSYESHRKRGIVYRLLLAIEVARTSFSRWTGKNPWQKKEWNRRSIQKNSSCIGFISSVGGFVQDATLFVFYSHAAYVRDCVSRVKEFLIKLFFT